MRFPRGTIFASNTINCLELKRSDSHTKLLKNDSFLTVLGSLIANLRMVTHGIGAEF